MRLDEDAKELVQEVATTTIIEAPKRISEVASLEEKVKDSCAALLAAMEGIGTAIDDFKPKSSEYIQMVRGFKMAIVSEISQSTNELKDIRKFFIGLEHENEIKRLREFVELCERLKKLKDDGTLDAISDVILKLS